jgi:hypothetical protein
MVLNNQERDSLKFKKVREAKKELKKIGTIKPHRGHSLFKMNSEGVFKVEENEFEYYYVIGKKKKKLIVEDNTLYVSALNKKNAIKKFKKMLAP